MAEARPLYERLDGYDAIAADLADCGVEYMLIGGRCAFTGRVKSYVGCWTSFGAMAA